RALSGSEAPSSQRTARAISGVGPCLRSSGRNEYSRSARRMISSGGRPGASPTRTRVTVARVSVMPSRDFAAACGHHARTYATAKEYQVRASFALAIEAGSPVSTSNGSPFLAAWRRSDRKLSARPLVLKVEDFSRWPTVQRTVWETIRGFLPGLSALVLVRMSQNLTL